MTGSKESLVDIGRVRPERQVRALNRPFAVVSLFSEAKRFLAEAKIRQKVSVS